jgi:hypothetical protein
MKFRADFVTNSSSSSYVLVVSEDAYKKALAAMIEPLREPIAEIESDYSKAKGIFGKPVKILGYISGMDGGNPFDYMGISDVSIKDLPEDQQEIVKAALGEDNLDEIDEAFGPSSYIFDLFTGYLRENFPEEYISIYLG